MKTLFALIAIGSIQNICAQQGAITWETKVQQIQVGGAIGEAINVNKVGTRPSLPIGPEGSIFQLWGWKLRDGQVIYEELIDTTQVGTYLPEAEITIVTRDPYEPFSRSRVDQPFSVEIDVSGLLPQDAAETLPEASTKVLVEHHVDLYTYGTFDGQSVESTRLEDQYFIDVNGITTLSFPYTNLNPSGGPATRAGQERFIVYALADEDLPQRILTQATVQMYPKAYGEIKEIDETKQYVELPDFQAFAERVYPGSFTWAEIYPGDHVAGKRGEDFPNGKPGTEKYPSPWLDLTFENFIPRVQPVKPGNYTIVLRTSSPFPGESKEEGGIELSIQSINMAKAIRINSSVTTME